MTTLTSAQFHILLTLAEGRRHGYGIMQEIERRTNGAMELGPGTLYRSIKQLLARDLIIEVDNGTDGGPDPGKQRRSYALTPRGKARTDGSPPTALNRTSISDSEGSTRSTWFENRIIMTMFFLEPVPARAAT